MTTHLKIAGGGGATRTLHIEINNMTTLEVAEYMLNTGKFYTAATLSKELGISLYNSNNKLYNIKTTKKYQTIIQGSPQTVKLVDIKGMKKKQEQWSKLLFNSWS